MDEGTDMEGKNTDRHGRQKYGIPANENNTVRNTLPYHTVKYCMEYRTPCLLLSELYIHPPPPVGHPNILLRVEKSKLYTVQCTVRTCIFPYAGIHPDPKLRCIYYMYGRMRIHTWLGNSNVGPFFFLAFPLTSLWFKTT